MRERMRKWSSLLVATSSKTWLCWTKEIRFSRVGWSREEHSSVEVETLLFNFSEEATLFIRSNLSLERCLLIVFSEDVPLSFDFWPGSPSTTLSTLFLLLYLFKGGKSLAIGIVDAGTTFRLFREKLADGVRLLLKTGTVGNSGNSEI